ncbi:UNVERIFIED_CONTAM: hypothetical protein GTU68_013193 [Idotea baltica]|nr:hypothetical protein [Idotea baltica]
MITTLDISLPPELVSDEESIASAIRAQLFWSEDDEISYRIVKRSLDARKRIHYVLKIEASKDEVLSYNVPKPLYKKVESRQEVHIIGAGPAGLFAALHCLEHDLRPIIYERGKDVRARRRDLAILNKEHVVNSESNYCFGEGGAGAYSDGKLYTRSKKRGNVKSVLETLVAHGADPEILIDAHPHIGTNKLPQIITEIRETITNQGGEVRFDCKMTDIRSEDGKLQSIVLNGEEEVPVEHLVLATGHSARDIFELLHARGIKIEQKPFALGVRVEHPQSMIDSVQYHRKERGEYLPPASYNLVCQAGGGGVYSFCMCPGGIIAPCATAPGEIVTNGWSPSKRNNPYANSGIVAEVKPEDLIAFDPKSPLAGMRFQASVEQRAWEAGGKTQVAPAQRLMDFVKGKQSKDLPDCSYFPGVNSVELSTVLPSRIHQNLQEGFRQFGQKMSQYLTNDAIVVATESRSSSPVRIPRDKVTLQHVEVSGLYPCGEGAGYAGGIISAAIDGQRCIEQIAINVSL